MVTACRSITTTAVESYSHAIPGVNLNAIRTGRGFGPNTIRSELLGDATIGTASTGFPVRGHMTMSDDSIVAALVSAAPPGTRWCGYDVEPGTTLLYAPRAAHTAVSPAGVEYAFAILQQSRLEKVADELQVHLEAPRYGEVRVIRPAPNPQSITSVLAKMLLPPIDAEHPSTTLMDITQALVAELARDSDRRQMERSSLRESRRIVGSCLEFVFDAGGSPSTAELCQVAHASERRLRNAFVDTFAVAPTEYFRYVRLNEARQRLLATNSRQTVTEVSVDLGIRNGGRFAHRYFELFGELPSTTLRSAS